MYKTLYLNLLIFLLIWLYLGHRSVGYWTLNYDLVENYTCWFLFFFKVFQSLKRIFVNQLYSIYKQQNFLKSHWCLFLICVREKIIKNCILSYIDKHFTRVRKIHDAGYVSTFIFVNTKTKRFILNFFWRFDLPWKRNKHIYNCPLSHSSVSYN